MAQSRFSLTWDGHKKNICNGLSALQQKEQFVDMTLAADGHFVKVHQIIIALASPYIKELISSANCQHPVIFLNKVSYTTLCAILEYIYTGEVLISVNQLGDLVTAAKELHITGLKEMNIANTSLLANTNESYVELEDEMEEYYEITENTNDGPIKREIVEDVQCTTEEELNKEMDTYVDETFEDSIQETTEIVTGEEMTTDNTQSMFVNKIESKHPHSMTLVKESECNAAAATNVMQYTVSNRGSLQMILNRFIYYLKHSNRNNTRQWRCVDYVSGMKCPAYVVTKGDVVVQRISAHTHTFHDKKILKKVQAGAIFSAILEAELEGENKKNLQENPQTKD